MVTFEQFVNDPINEDLRKWFKDKWVRMDTKGNIKGDCAREPGEGKPKCLPLAKARAMDKEDRAKAARRKRREDPVADRPGKGGKPVNVRTEEYIEEKNRPTKPELWSRAKSLARSKFDVYPSAYANGWAAKWYKSKGGGWQAESFTVPLGTSGKRKAWHPPLRGIRMADGSIKRLPPGKSGSSGGGNGGGGNGGS